MNLFPSRMYDIPDIEVAGTLGINVCRVLFVCFCFNVEKSKYSSY